ncbi:hypothetical protein MPDQ_000455 [Monascus purpureus]|uniref:Uncharacterized protein n=1 Tax=Monascus purpureus TaxID=5098 RepID=A0A507QTR3_MONPU|nr:hypothetical protein MPDQ_000455 [Monascus purpureus]
MHLRETADDAEDVAAGFRVFREPLPQFATEITGLIAELYAISSSLKSLDDLANDHRHHHNLRLASGDLELVRVSLNYTLDDIIHFFGSVESWKDPPQEIYRNTWTELLQHFRKEAHYSLAIRLQKYKALLKELEDLMRDARPDATLISGLRDNIKALLPKQEKRLLPFVYGAPSNAAEQGNPGAERKPCSRRSYERPRPSRLASSTSSSSATSSDVPPSAPSAPDSLADSNLSPALYGLENHWAREVFSDNPNDPQPTPIPFVGERPKCLGDPILGLKQWLHDEGFEELFQLAFSDRSTELRVSFYVRESDFRARIICRRRRGGQELVLWASLKFNTIERMVLFFCTFIALRAQDSGRPVENIRDYELEMEEELFGGDAGRQINDDGFLHALRVYRDAVSGAVRLQSSVHNGEMKRAPVWTAFITSYIKSRDWMRRTSATVVVLRKLHLSIFDFSDYHPPQLSGGDYILNFTSAFGQWKPS